MQEMSVAATTGEGGQMTVNVNGSQMNVTVPAGVKEGQNFTFQVPAAAQAVGTPVVAQAAPVVAQANYTPTGIPGVQLNNSLAPNMVQGGMVAPGSGPPPGCAAGGSWQSKKARRSAPPPPPPGTRPAARPPRPPRLAAGSPPRCPHTRANPLRCSAAQFFGDKTCMAMVLVAVLFWPAVCCVPCCPCDERMVYTNPADNKDYMPTGQVATDKCC